VQEFLLEWQHVVQEIKFTNASMDVVQHTIIAVQKKEMLEHVLAFNVVV